MTVTKLLSYVGILTFIPACIFAYLYISCPVYRQLECETHVSEEICRENCGCYWYQTNEVEGCHSQSKLKYNTLLFKVNENYGGSKSKSTTYYWYFSLFLCICISSFTTIHLSCKRSSITSLVVFILLTLCMFSSIIMTSNGASYMKNKQYCNGIQDVADRLDCDIVGNYLYNMFIQGVCFTAISGLILIIVDCNRR
jgi:hypothetical protein